MNITHTEKDLTRISKYLSFILRHKPDEIGLTLDTNGWVDIAELIAKTTSFQLSLDLIQIVVETNNKQRFAISKDGKNIRANQGHSVDIELGLEATEPPKTLFHGTAERFLSSIQTEGLIKGNRHHVHLTESEAVADSVGSRYGKPILLTIDTLQMHQAGFSFYKTANNVWLVDNVPLQYIRVGK